MDKIDCWKKINKLTINYKKSCYMIVAKNTVKKTHFELSINHNLINLKNEVKYLGVHLDNKLTWKPYIDILCEATTLCSIKNTKTSLL